MKMNKLFFIVTVFVLNSYLLIAQSINVSGGGTWTLGATESSHAFRFWISYTWNGLQTASLHYKVDGGGQIPSNVVGDGSNNPSYVDINLGEGEHTIEFIWYGYDWGKLQWFTADTDMKSSTVKFNVYVTNIFNGGDVSIDSQTKASGSAKTVFGGNSIGIGTSEQSYDNYWWVWNGSSSYPSEWRKIKYLSSPSYLSSSQSTTYGVDTDDNSTTLEAGLRKLCSLEFNNSYSSMYINGSTYSSTTTVGVVEQNSITAYGNTYTSSGIEYRFSHWSYSGGTSSSTVTPTAHGIYTANYDNGRPVYVSFSFGSTVGDPVRVIWTDNSNSAVTQYKIYRRAYINGSYTSITLVGTVSNGVGYFDDPDYLLTNWQQGTWLEYSVEAYYSTAGTWSDGGWERIYGQLYKQNEKTELVEIPADYSIKNYPNPFNPTTTINYQLPKDGMVTIKVYDVLGKEVATLVNEHKSAGYYKADFDASKLTSGVYICSIQASGFSKSIKLLLTK